MFLRNSIGGCSSHGLLKKPEREDERVEGPVEKVVEGHRGERKDGTVSRQSSGQGTRVKYIGVRGNYSPT